MRISDREAKTAADRTFNELYQALSNAEERMAAFVSDLGGRNINNLYLHDAVTEVQVLSRLLRMAVQGLVRAPGTVRWPR